MNGNTCSNLRKYEDVPLSSQELLQHHEDSGIEISSIKKDDNLEGEDFLERARKVSSNRAREYNCDDEATIFDQCLTDFFHFKFCVYHILTCASCLVCV